MKKIIRAILVISIFFCMTATVTAADSFTLTHPSTDINVQTVDGEYYLFLPSSVNISNLKLDFGKESALISGNDKKYEIRSNSGFNLRKFAGNNSTDGVYRILIDSTPVNIMVSENIAAMYINSENSSENRLWVEKNKNNKAKGTMKMVNADGSVVYSGDLKQIKGRGNSTWGYVKKPYQIKLGKATDLMETGNPDEANTTWILLANYKDMSFLKNHVTFSLARKIDFSFTPNDRFVDLYYDGEYRGIYQLTEKTEVGTGRVDITNLEKKLEKANSNIEDFDKLKEVRTVNSLGNECQYIDGINDAQDMTGGYLIEMDFRVRGLAEKSWFVTSRGQMMVSKSPEYLNSTGIEYISKLYQQFENAVYSGGFDYSSGKDYRDIVDANSLAKYYMIEELSQDVDAFSSSTFLYKKPGLDQKLYFGPIWDFDMGYGFYWNDKSDNVSGLGAAKTDICKKLLAMPSFQQALAVMFNEYSDKINETADEIVEISKELSSSVRMNSVMWPENTIGDGSSEQNALKSFIEKRSEYLIDVLSSGNINLDEGAGFFDVSDSDWFADDVDYVVSKGFFKGSNTGYFLPRDAMTRAMTIQVMYNIYGNPQVTGNVNFVDIPYENWCRNAVVWGVENNITKGTSDTTFSPNAFVTRQDFMTMLYRCWGNGEECMLETDAPDAYAIKDYAVKAMAWAIKNGIINGDDFGMLRPRDSITRSEAAAIIHRVEEKIPS